MIESDKSKLFWQAYYKEVHSPGLFQTSRYCRAELNSRIKFDLGTAVARSLKPFNSAGCIKFGTTI